MSTILSTLLPIYGGAISIAVVSSIVIKIYFQSKAQQKMKEYQHQIVRSHSQILKLEAHNEKLERRIAQLEASIPQKRYAYS
jgi:cell division protein FtsB